MKKSMASFQKINWLYSMALRYVDDIRFRHTSQTIKNLRGAMSWLTT